MIMLPLLLERARAPNEEYEEITFLPFKRAKATLHWKLILCRVGAINIGENRND